MSSTNATRGNRLLRETGLDRKEREKTGLFTGQRVILRISLVELSTQLGPRQPQR